MQYYVHFAVIQVYLVLAHLVCFLFCCFTYLIVVINTQQKDINISLSFNNSSLQPTTKKAALFSTEKGNRCDWHNIMHGNFEKMILSLSLTFYHLNLQNKQLVKNIKPLVQCHQIL